MHLKRLIVAAIFLPLLFAYINYLPQGFFFALLLCISMVAMAEFCIMYRVPRRLYIPGIISGGVLIYVSYSHPKYFLDTIFLCIFLILLLRLITIRSPSGSMRDISPLGIGFFYISVFLSYQMFLRELGKEYIFFLYTSVWVADSMAYYIGTYMGKSRLYPSVSPNKTIEGAAGSLIGGGIGAIIIKTLFDMPGITTLTAVVLGVILGMAAVVGDLIESMFKRDAGVKDSSSLIPGHGGLLDKLDGFLIAGPVLYILLERI